LKEAYAMKTKYLVERERLAMWEDQSKEWMEAKAVEEVEEEGRRPNPNPNPITLI